jgi:nucleoside-diphosphate-sugar epimerase
MHSVVALSRKDPRNGVTFVRGDFAQFEHLRRLDGHQFDAVVHLGAVTGGCTERDGILVNVEGTRALMRYLTDRGCRKFVMASSIAAVGLQNIRFRPVQLPIPDEHPCLDRDGYGLSKYLMEEVTRYLQRQHADIDVINLRLSSVPRGETLPALQRAQPLREWAPAGITIMALSDAVRAFTLAVEAPRKPGVRVLNATGPRAWVADAMVDVLRAWWGDDVDFSYYADPAHAYDSLYDVRRIRDELGFVAQVTPPALSS